MLRLRYMLVVMTLCGCGSFFVAFKEDLSMVFVCETSVDSYVANPDEWFTVNTEGCSIPVLKPLGAHDESFVKYPFTPRCPDANNALLGNNRYRIWVRYNKFQYYNINRRDSLSCCYRSFYRPKGVSNIESPNIDDRYQYSPCRNFEEVVEVKDEFVKIECSVGKRNIYEQFYLFATKKKFKMHNNFKAIVADHNNTVYNVLVLGVDSVSRVNFHRMMPKTAKYLQNKGAMEFMGYNRIADKKIANIVAMLVGLNMTELRKTCYPYDTMTFDNCPFVWEWFKQAGYYTAFVEDAPNLGVFNLARSGFGVAPTDYYPYTFMTEAVKHVGACKDFNSFLCMHDTYFYKVLINYIEELTWRLKNKMLFGLFWETSMSHDYLNYPMKIDEDYLKLFGKLEASGYLRKTFVILVSDHGMKWGPMRLTKQGRLEEQLPVLNILPPPSFQYNYKKAYINLKQNSKKLTTPFDLHATLSDLIDLKNVENDVISRRSSRIYARDRGISLFIPIPGNRTCQMANIDDRCCTCQKEIVLKKHNSQAFEAAKTLVLLINDMFMNYSQCAKLAVSDMVDVTKVEVGEPEPDESSWTDFMVVVKTMPGDGVFEAVLRQDDEDLSWKLVGSPSRLNSGNQSRCIDHHQIRHYCYCG